MDVLGEVRGGSHVKENPQGEYQIMLSKTPFTPHPYPQVFLCWGNLFLCWRNLGTTSLRDVPKEKANVQSAGTSHWV